MYTIGMGGVIKGGKGTMTLLHKKNTNFKYSRYYYLS